LRPDSPNQKAGIQKLPLLNVTVQLTTFEGAHNPPYDLVTITFSNKCSTEWKAIDIKSRPLKPDEISCQDY